MDKFIDLPDMEDEEFDNLDIETLLNVLKDTVGEEELNALFNSGLLDDDDELEEDDDIDLDDDFDLDDLDDLEDDDLDDLDEDSEDLDDDL